MRFVFVLPYCPISTALHSAHEVCFFGVPTKIIPTKHPSGQDWYDWMFFWENDVSNNKNLAV